MVQTRIRLWAALCAAVLSASAVQAADSRIDGTATTENGGNAIGPGDSLTVGANGLLQVAGDAVDATANGVTVINDGRISSTNAEGVEIAGANAVVTNNGSVTAGVRAVEIAGNGARVTNAGALQATAGPGIEITGSGATVGNSGTLRSGGDGISITGSGAVIDNSGVLASAGASVAVAGDNAQVRNSGTATSTRGGGILLRGAGARVDNSGRLTANAGGVLIIGDNARVTNTGTITSTAGSGIVVSGSGATVSNTGTVTGAIFGIQVAGDNAQVTNSGRVTGGAGAIVVLGNNARVTLQRGSVLVGGLQLVGTNASFNFDLGTSRNAAYSFTGQRPGTITAAHSLSAVSNSGIYLLDPGLFRAGNDLFAALTRGIQDGLRGGSEPGERPETVTRGPGDTAGGAWVNAFGSYASLPDSAGATGYATTAGGILAGRSVSDHLGVFAGAASGSVRSAVTSFTADASSVFAGLQGRTETRGIAADYSLSFGYGWTTTTRTVASNTAASGIETPRGRYGSLFVSPALRLTPAHSTSHLRPELGLRYAAQFSQAYTETGASTVMAVAAQTTHLVEARPVLTYRLTPMRWGDSTALVELSAGAELRSFFGGAVASSFAGTPLPVAATSGSFEARGFLGAAVTLAGDARWTLKGEAEIGQSTRNRTDGRLGLQLNITF